MRTRRGIKMNEFQNKMILKVENYKNGLYPEIPNCRKQGSAFVLAEGVNDDIVVNENTSSKQIRKGKYKKLIEISTHSYMKEIRINSISKENAYSFEVYIKAVIQVKDPIKFYENINLDIDAYFENLLSMDVRKITRKYSVLDYEGMDDELFRKLSSYSTVDGEIGFAYSISVVDAVPGKTAQEYVERVSKQQLEAKIKDKARTLLTTYTSDYEQAIMTEVIEGKLSETEAIIKIKEYKNRDVKEKTERMEEFLQKGLLTDAQVKEFMMREMNMTVPKKQHKEKTQMNEFYKGEDAE